MAYRAHVDFDFPTDRFAVHLGKTRLGGELDVLQPVDLSFAPTDPAVWTPPAFRLERDAARALYDALGAALGIHTPDARLAAETLEREQRRVDKFIDWWVSA